jgi:hypothetical protein
MGDKPTRARDAGGNETQDAWKPADAVLLASVFIVTVVVFGPFALLRIDPHHDGIILKPALDVLSGQVPFRDTFSQYGFGLPVLHAAILWLLGPSLAALRAATVVAYAGAATLFMAAWRQFLPRGLAVWAFVVWLCLPWFYHLYPLLAWSSAYALLFQGAALAALLTAIRGWRPRGFGFACGIACAAAFACRQPVGAATFAAAVGALGLAWWRGSPRRDRCPAWFACVAGMLVGVGIGLAALAAVGALSAWWFETVVWPRRWVESWPDPMWRRFANLLLPWPDRALPWLALGAAALVPLPLIARLRNPRSRSRAHLFQGLLVLGLVVLILRTPPLLAASPLWYVPGIPIVIVLGTVTSMWGSFSARQPIRDTDLVVIAAAFVALASWPQYFPRFCFMHAFWALTPGVGVAVYFAWRASGRRTAAVVVVSGALLLPLVRFHVRGASEKLSRPYAVLEGPPVLAGMRVPVTEQADWEALLSALAAWNTAHPSTALLVEGPDGLWASLAPNLRNPGPFYVDWKIPGTNLEPNRVHFILLERPLVFLQRPASPAVAQAMQLLKYRQLAATGFGRLLAPPDAEGRSGLTP